MSSASIGDNATLWKFWLPRYISPAEMKTDKKRLDGIKTPAMFAWMKPCISEVRCQNINNNQKYSEIPQDTFNYCPTLLPWIKQIFAHFMDCIDQVKASADQNVHDSLLQKHIYKTFAILFFHSLLMDSPHCSAWSILPKECPLTLHLSRWICQTPFQCVFSWDNLTFLSWTILYSAIVMLAPNLSYQGLFMSFNWSINHPHMTTYL